MEESWGRARAWAAIAARSIAVAIAIALPMAAAERAAAHDAHAHAREVPGLELVDTPIGPSLLTHGRDPIPASAEDTGARRGLPAGLGYAPGDSERAPVCGEDYFQHVIYARLASSPDRYAASAGRIRSAVRRMNAVLNAESIASGGGSADLQVRCTGGAEIEVSKLTTTATGFGQVVSAARAAGFDGERADYAIYFDGGGANACGIASYNDDDRLVLENESNSGGDYAVIYERCWETEIPMHEAGHMMGAVQYWAPHSTGSGGHCFQENDVVCYSPDGGDRNQGGSRQDCNGEARFDCGFDDYFDSAPEPGEYLESNWNLGSPLNRFITFGDRPDNVIDAAAEVIELLLRPGRTRAKRSGTAAATGEWRFYKLKVTGGAKRLTVRVRKAKSDRLALYVRSRKRPDTNKYSCRAKVRRGTATCTIPRPRGGTWIAGLLSGESAEGRPFRIEARLDRR